MTELPALFELFSSRLQDAVSNACRVAHEESAPLSSKHLLQGLLVTQGSAAAEALRTAGLDETPFPQKGGSVDSARSTAETGEAGTVEEVLSELTQEVESPAHDQAQVRETFATLTDEGRDVLLKSMLLAESRGHAFVGTEHVLASMIDASDSLAYNYLLEQGLGMTTLRQHLEQSLNEMSSINSAATSLWTSSEDMKQPTMPPSTGMNPIASAQDDGGQHVRLEDFCRDLTSKEITSKTDPLIGRDAELERLTNILARRGKNNPLLVGEPGVGKTALMKGLAKRIVEGQVPEVLRGKRIFELDLAKVIAGTMFRGEFEGRLKKLLDQASADPNIILFIDEIHTIMGLGNASGSMDMASVLKPLITATEMQLAGATTHDEYRKHIAKDPAMARRFQAVMVEEPSEEDAVCIIQGLREQYEQFHQVRIPDSTIEAAVRLTDRYMQDRALPDKAIDALDEAASQMKIAKLEQGVAKLAGRIESRMEDIEQRKRRAVEEGDYEKALLLREKERLMKAELRRVRSQRNGNDRRHWPQVMPNRVAEAVSKATGIPAETMLATERRKLAKLEQTLKSHVIGQDEAVEAVSKVIKRARAGISNPNRPLGSFLFLGPTGVGKTELAKVVAREVFGSEKAMVRIDMSEFGEKFNASKLIGSPAGYVGHEDGGMLTEQVRRNPYSVVLFDEIEKAHPDIFHLLLQVLDDGILTDASGKTVNFRNTIIIMTSNNGVTNVAKRAMGFGEDEARTEGISHMQYEDYKNGVLAQLQDTFRPEFINRIDKTLVFKPLSQEAVRHIVDLQIDALNARLAEQDVHVSIGKAARDELARQGFDPEFGARPLRRTIQALIEDPLADLLIEGVAASGSVIQVLKRKAGLVLQPKQETVAHAA